MRKISVKSFFKINLKQMMFAILMGSLALTVRNLGLYFIVYYPYRIDPRWVFSLLGACWTGPIGGLMCGFLAAMKYPFPLRDLACIPVHFVIGLTSWLLIRHNRKCLYACFLWPILGVPSYWLASLVVMPAEATILLVQFLAFIGISTGSLAFAVGLAVEKRAKYLLSLLGTY